MYQINAMTFHKYPYFIDLKCSLIQQLFILPAQFESIYISRQTFVVTNLFLKLGRNCNLSSYEVILRQTYLQINQQDILLLFSSTYLHCIQSHHDYVVLFYNTSFPFFHVLHNYHTLNVIFRSISVRLISNPMFSNLSV